MGKKLIQYFVVAYTGTFSSPDSSSRVFCRRRCSMLESEVHRQKDQRLFFRRRGPARRPQKNDEKRRCREKKAPNIICSTGSQYQAIGATINRASSSSTSLSIHFFTLRGSF